MLTYPDNSYESTLNSTVSSITVNNVSVSSAEDCDAVILLRGVEPASFIPGVIVSNVATWHSDLGFNGMCYDCNSDSTVCIYDMIVDNITSASYNMPKSAVVVYFYLFDVKKDNTYNVNFNYSGEATAYLYDNNEESLDCIELVDGKITFNIENNMSYLYIGLNYSATSSATYNAVVTVS